MSAKLPMPCGIFCKDQLIQQLISYQEFRPTKVQQATNNLQKRLETNLNSEDQEQP